ncbi:ATPase family AAA domain-containing protein 1-A [Ananas comosus]|uniref:ATPase family AAA domain-containing protein 1-A n=1 Tax=Ananas comosus TaxID=4615 RepID=A0A199VQ77_ANACO|nr:ATPase family AAA domain-containing protein 1-A [Ananas comosus]
MITKLARISRLARAILPWQFAAAATPHLSPPPYPVPSQRPLPPPRTLFDHQPRPRTIPRTDSYSTTKSSFSRFSFLPAVFLMGAVGFGSVQLAYADADEEGYTPHSAPPSVSGEDLVTQERKKIEDLLRSRGMQRSSYPPFSVAVKGQKVVVKFNITSSSKVAVARQLTLNPPERMKEVEGGKLEDNFCVLIFESLVGPEYSEIEFIKRGSLSLKELDALVSALRLAGEKDANETSVKNPKSYSFREGNSHGSKRTPSVEKSVSALEAMGVRVYGLDETSGIPADGTIFWENIAGYDQQKREIEDTILLALQNPEVYDDIARGTRCKFESNRPRAVLFEGPPGTGKTSSARVIAKQAGVPLLYVPLEVIMSKYYGESERLLSSVFSLANELPDGAIIFLDEVDSFAVSRDSEMHEATRRILSVILRQIDGFEQEKRVVVIAATNRKEDLDPALISRFDSMIIFDLPDQPTREEIAAQYAKHLKKAELVQFALVTEEMSGRDIRDVCQQAERHWASKLIRGQAPRIVKGEPSLPPIEEYIKCAEERRKALAITVGTRRMSKSLALA